MPHPKIITVSCFVFLLLLGFSAPRGPDSVTRDYTKLVADLSAARDAEKQAGLLAGFLEKHPESPYTSYLMQVATAVIAHELRDPARMLDLADAVLPGIEDTKLRREVRVIQLELYNELGMTEKIRSAVKELAADGDLPFPAHMGLADAYVKIEEWEKALMHYGIALTLSTNKAVLEENPGYAGYTSAVDALVRDRKTKALTGIGWTHVLRGRMEEGFASFSRAEEFAEIDLFGAPEGDLYWLWGRALLKKGDVNGAVAKFTPGVLTRDDARMEEMLKTLFVEQKGDEVGFDDYLLALREMRDVRIDEFTLPDYEGQEHTFSSMTGEKATLLVFWHPG